MIDLATQLGSLRIFGRMSPARIAAGAAGSYAAPFAPVFVHQPLELRTIKLASDGLHFVPQPIF
jgi:hypothetical protein